MPGFKPTLDEWKKGKLHSGSKKGPVVKSQKQALAIAYSEAGETTAKKKRAPAASKGEAMIHHALHAQRKATAKAKGKTRGY